MKLDALTRPVSDIDKNQYKNSSPTARTDSIFQGSALREVLSGSGLFVVALLFWIWMFFLFAIPALQVAMVLCAIVTLCVLVYALFDLRKRTAKKFEQSARLWKLAKDNDWAYQNDSAAGNENGVFFTGGIGSKKRDVIITPKYEIGVAEYTVDDKHKTRRSFGYVSFPLSRSVPNMILDAKANNLWGITNLPVKLDKNEKVVLEGGFDKYFKLYVPSGYGMQARYVFTPDIMALLMDEASLYDVEIIDNKVYLYIGEVQWGSVAFWKRVDRVVTSINNKVESQTDRYSDRETHQISGDTLPPLVFEHGRRLKRGLTRLQTIIVTAFLLFLMSLQFIV